MVDSIDSAAGKDRVQIADVALDDVEVGHVAKPIPQQAGKIVVTLDDDNPAIRPGVPGNDSRDRACPGPQLDQGIDCRPVDVANRGLRQPPAGRGNTRDRSPLPQELTQEKCEIAHRPWVKCKGVVRKPGRL